MRLRKPRPIKIRSARRSDLPAWVKLRLELWPDGTPAEFLRETKALLESRSDSCLVAVGGRELLGFAEW